MPILLHSRVFVANYGYGTVLFLGQASFSEGVWVGIALDPGQGVGKNDGSIKGKRYFDAEPGRGIFVRPNTVTVMEESGYDVEGQGEIPDETMQGHDIEVERERDQEHFSLSDSAPSSPRLTTPQSRYRATSAKPLTARDNPAAGTRVVKSAILSRVGSPDKDNLRTQSRPSLASRPSIASSTASSAGTGTAARRSIASSPSKPTPNRQSSPSKGTAASLLQRPAHLPRPAASSRVSTASVSSTTASPLPRLSTASSRSASGRATTAGSVGSVAAPQPNSTSKPSISTASRSAARAPATSDAVTSSADTQAGSARAGLRTVSKVRPSMAAPHTIRRGLSALSAPHQTSTPQGATGSAPNESDLSLSPSADARKRMELARAKTETQQQQQLLPHTVHISSEEDDENLFECAGTGGSLQLGAALTSSVSKQDFNALKREVEELRVKNRLNEKRREEERARVKELEAWQEDAADKVKISESSLQKAQKLSTEVLALQTTVKELAILNGELDDKVEELTEQLEMAALDREVAEEKAEAAVAELHVIKQLNEELTLEADLLREETKAYEEGASDAGEQTTTAWIHLQKQNERLKEALVRLRDVTAETDSEQRRKVSELEKEIESLADVQDARDTLARRLQANEAQLEDVKTQLDDALGAEEMVEQLTERNLFLGERMNEMTAGIEELEALKELNEELEEIHVETEKQLQEELDLREIAVREWEARCQALETSAVDYEATFSQFRELVLNLQNDLEALKAERDGLIEGGQSAAQIHSQSREMLNLNMKLQSSALKSQARIIESELGRIKADQSALHLEMLSPYVPAPFAEEGDRDALAGVLFFKRIASKADLIKSVLESNHGIPQAIHSLSIDVATTAEDGSLSLTAQKIPEDLVFVCQFRHSLAHFSAVCTSVVAMLRLASPKVFLKCGQMFKEAQAAVEGRVDAFVESLRREELKEVECNAEFKRFVRHFEEISYALSVAQEEETHNEMEAARVADSVQALPTHGDGDLAAKEVGSATLLDLDLDTLTASLCSAHSLMLREPIAWQLQGRTLEGDFLEPLHRLYSDIEATKLLAKKLLRRLSSLATNEEAVSMAAIGDLPSLGQLSSKLVGFAIALDSGVLTYLNDTKASGSPFVLIDLLASVRSAVRELTSRDEDSDEAAMPHSGDPWSSASAATAYLAATINELVAAATEQANVIKIGGVAPWHPRSSAIHGIASHNVELERQALKLQEDLRDLYQQIKARDGLLQEGTIKLERLSKRLEKSKGQEAESEETKARLSEARQQAKTYQDANEVLQAELDALEKVKEALEAQVSNSKTRDGAQNGGITDATGDAAAISECSIPPMASISPAGHLETNYLLDQLDAMRGVVKYMRKENALWLSGGLSSELHGLAPLVHDTLTSAVETRSTTVLSDELQEAESILTGLPHKARLAAPKEEELRSVARERKHLYSSLLQLAASPRVVVLPPVNDASAAVTATVAGDGQISEEERATQSADDGTHTKGLEETTKTQRMVVVRPWQPSCKMPLGQYEAQRAEMEVLGLRFERFLERSRGSFLSRQEAMLPSRSGRKKLAAMAAAANGGLQMAVVKSLLA